MYAVWRGATCTMAPEETGVIPVSFFLTRLSATTPILSARSPTSNLSRERTLDQAQDLEGRHSGQALGH